jgi:hypothetical protein
MGKTFHTGRKMMIHLIGMTGITLIIVRASIFHGLRDWLLEKRPKDVGYLFTCTQCMGFWVGLIGGVVYFDILTALMYAGGVSLLSMVADRWIMRD